MPGNTPWKVKMHEMFQVCQDELKRTTEIGKKMLTASKTNSTLHESYEELGMLAFKALESGKLAWDDSRVADLVGMIKDCEKGLEKIESEVNNIKFAAEEEKGKK
jgi:hypothetical protein